MKIVNVRSPFVIQINEATQIGSKIELFIWNNGTTEPTTPTYTLSKPIATTNQRNTSYNISNFVREYIQNISTTYSNWITTESNTDWCFFKVKRYWDNAGSYTLLDTNVYVGVNGFTNYMDGLQTTTNSIVKYLFNPDINLNYFKQNTYPVDTIQHIDVMVDFANLTDIFRITYNRIDGTTYSFDIDNTGVTGVFMLSIPISIVKINSNFENGCRVDLKYIQGGITISTQSFYTYPICEVKYTPVLCDFVNRFGGWQTITFYKAQTNNINVKNEDYKLSPEDVNYNPLRGQTKSLNFIGTQVIKVNTGWVEENYSELITDLLLSEKVLIDGKPVILKTSSSELKTKLKNRLINYEIDFEYSYNLINDNI